MGRIGFLGIRIVISLLIGFCLFNFALKENENVNQKPNIIWIMAEDLSPRLGCYGDTLSKTPNIDSLGRKGVIFKNAFTCSGVCAPSRAAIITGMYSTSIGTHHMRNAKSLVEMPGIPSYSAVPPPDVKAFPEYLRKEGYYCTNNFKTDYQFGEPFTVWDNHSRNAHWRDRPKDVPFFSVFTFEITHEVNVWPLKVREDFFSGLSPEARKKLNPEITNPTQLSKQEYTNPNSVTVPPYYADTRIVREDIARHYDNIKRLDKQVGKLIKELKEDGLLENTIIFFMGDHGDGLPRAKRTVYDAGIKTPLIVFAPKKYKHKVDERLLSFVDLAPTVLRLAGVSIPGNIQGKPFLGGKAEESWEREYVFAARDRMDDQYDLVRAIRDKQFKYIRNYFPERPYLQNIKFQRTMPLLLELELLNSESLLKGSDTLLFQKVKPARELYDITKDFWETNNLAEDPKYKEIVSKMDRALEAWRVQTKDLGDIPEAKLAEIAWPGGKQPQTEIPVITKIGKGSKTHFDISCPTQGASIGYKFLGEEKWRLYSGNDFLKVERPIIAKAVRYGYQESKEVMSH